MHVAHVEFLPHFPLALGESAARASFRAASESCLRARTIAGVMKLNLDTLHALTMFFSKEDLDWYSLTSLNDLALVA